MLQTDQVEHDARSVPGPIDFLIVTPLEVERNAVLSLLEGFQQLPPDGQDNRVYFESRLVVGSNAVRRGEYRIIVVPLVGMGTGQASATVSDAIRRWVPRYVLVVGIAGGVRTSGIALGDVVVASQIADYTLQKHRSGKPAEIRWQVLPVDTGLLERAHNFLDKEWLKKIKCIRPTKGEPTRHIGPIASGDHVVASEELLAVYQGSWPKLIGVEMEGAGIARVAFQSMHKPGFFMIRGVSDLADRHKDSREVADWRTYACEIAAEYALSFLRSGPVTFSNAQEAYERQEMSAEISSRTKPNKQRLTSTGNTIRLIIVCLVVGLTLASLVAYGFYARAEFDKSFRLAVPIDENAHAFDIIGIPTTPAIQWLGARYRGPKELTISAQAAELQTFHELAQTSQVTYLSLACIDFRAKRQSIGSIIRALAPLKELQTVKLTQVNGFNLDDVNALASLNNVNNILLNGSDFPLEKLADLKQSHLTKLDISLRQDYTGPISLKAIDELTLTAPSPSTDAFESISKLNVKKLHIMPPNSVNYPWTELCAELAKIQNLQIAHFPSGLDSESATTLKNAGKVIHDGGITTFQ